MSTDEVARPRPTQPCPDSRNAVPARRLAAVALLLAAINLRPAVTALGPVLDEVRAGLGMSATVAGLLTSVPAACFALVGVVAPRLADRYGPSGVIAVGTAATTLGLAVRPFAPTVGAFLALSALALAGIAVVNVLLPAVVKRYFPDRVGAMTGLYSMALNVGAATAAAVTVPMTGTLNGDWRFGIGAWALVAAMAVPFWLLLARSSRGHGRGRLFAAGHGGESRRAMPSATGVRLRPHAPGRGAATDAPNQSLRNNPTAWALAVYFGLQATSAYVIMGWLPQIFRDAGLSAETAGLLFAVTSLLGIPLSLALSAVAGRFANQSGIAAALALCGMGGYTGLLLVPTTLPWLWAVLLGLVNSSFPLALTMIGLRGRDSTTVVRLSAFTQSTGYLLSIPGPVLVGALYQHGGDWRAPLLFMVLLMLPQLVAGLLAGRDRQIG